MFKETVLEVAGSYIFEKGEVSKHEIYETMKKAGCDFGDKNALADRAILMKINQVLSRCRIGGKRQFETIRRLENGKVKFVKIPSTMLKNNPDAAAYAREQSAKRMIGEAKRSPVISRDDGKIVLNLLKKAK